MPRDISKHRKRQRDKDSGLQTLDIQMYYLHICHISNYFFLQLFCCMSMYVYIFYLTLLIISVLLSGSLFFIFLKEKLTFLSVVYDLIKSVASLIVWLATVIIVSNSWFVVFVVA